MSTIYDVAKHAGVSIATVSKVLTGRRYVSDETRKKVLSVVTELQYKPNFLARGLASDRTNLVGLVLSFDPHDLFADPNLLQLIYGVELALNNRDNALLLSTANSPGDPMSSFRHLLGSFRTDGVIIETGLGDVGIDLLLAQGYTCVVTGYTSVDVPCVHPDDDSGARQMTEFLLSLGHRRIGVITGPPVQASQARMQGFLDVLELAGIQHSAELVVPGTYRTDSGYAAAERLMSLSQPPSAIFAFNDRMAIGAMQWLREHGLRVPEDVSVTGFDDIPLASQCSLPLTTVRQTPQEIGMRSVELLFAILAGEEISSREVVLPTNLIVRGSAAPLAAP
jgi:DNA-binding LacI/PurR family transcriptional regulator